MRAVGDPASFVDIWTAIRWLDGRRQEATLQDGGLDAASRVAILPQPAKWKVEEEGKKQVRRHHVAFISILWLPHGWRKEGVPPPPPASLAASASWSGGKEEELRRLLRRGAGLR